MQPGNAAEAVPAPLISTLRCVKYVNQAKFNKGLSLQSVH